MPRISAVARIKRLRVFIVFSHIPAQLQAVFPARGGDGEDVCSHGKGDLGHTRGLFEVFKRQLDDAAAHPIRDKLAAHHVQLFLLHAVVKGRRRGADFTGVRADKRHIVDGQKKAIADLLFSGPQAAHLARHSISHIREKPILRADEHRRAARCHGGRFQVIIPVNSVCIRHKRSSLLLLPGLCRSS